LKRRNPIQHIERSPAGCIGDVRTRAVFQQITDEVRVSGTNGDMKRGHSFVGSRVHGIACQCPGYATGVVDCSVHLSIHVGAMQNHEIEKLRIDSANTTTANVIIGSTRNACGIQEWGEPHSVDIRIGTLLYQQSRDVHIVADQGPQQRRRARAEERIAEASALVAETAHVELGIQIDAGCQQGVQDFRA
jgi:hypothetical protein